MLNQVILVGRVVGRIKDIKKENENDKSIVTLAVPRSFKNLNGEYETDFIDCSLFGNVANSVKEYCKKGDLIGIKGRLQKDENKELKVIAEKVTFLAMKK